jgi:hypothetical protein
MSEGRGLGDFLGFLGEAIVTGKIPDNGSPMVGPDTCRLCHPHPRHGPEGCSRCYCAGPAAAAQDNADTIPAPVLRADPDCPKCEGVGERMARGNVIVPCECTGAKKGS